MRNNYFNTLILAFLSGGFTLTLPADADPLTEGAYEAVIGLDSRYAVNPYAYPHNAVARITYPGDRNVCSGWLSNANTLVTAGHCVWDTRLKTFVTIDKVYPGYDGNRNTPLNGTCSIKAQYAHQEFINSENPAFDVGVIKLDCSNQNLQPLPYAYLPEGIDFKGVSVTVSGYPADKSSAEWQWAGQGKLLDYTPSILTYDTDTNGGMSGSPIWLEAGNGKPPLVIGIHTSGYSSNGVGTKNEGVHLTESLMASIKAVEAQP